MIRLLESQQRSLRGDSNRLLLEQGMTDDMKQLSGVYAATKLYAEGK
jgi:hypothetical protein